MDILYEEGKGLVYTESVSWLQSPSEHLKMSGALAIGNFARNGEFGRVRNLFLCLWVAQLKTERPMGITTYLVVFRSCFMMCHATTM